MHILSGLIDKVQSDKCFIFYPIFTSVSYSPFIIYNKHSMNSWLTLLCLFVGVCSQCSSNCLLCLSGTCVLCQPGYALTLSAVCTARSVANCRLYSSATSCQLCEATFQHVNGTCVKDYSGCVSRTVKGSCNFCTFGTVLSENTCKGVLNC